MEAHKLFTEFIDKLNSMELKDKDLYKQYSIMKNASKVLSERVDEISEIIFEEMNRTGEKKKVFDYGAFTLVPKDKWVYSDVVKNKETELKEVKKREQEDGIAQKEVTEYLLFK